MNLIFIVLDCLRLDYSEHIWNILKKYGFTKLEAISAASWTIPSHASIITGMYPSEHGAHETKNRKVGEIVFRVKNNLVNDLKKKGYTTHLYTANAFLTERFGFNDFDHIYFNSNIPDKLYLKPEELKILTEETLVGSAKDVLLKMIKNRKIKLLLKGSSVYLYRKFSEKIGGWPVEKGITKITSKIKKTEFREPFFLFMNLMELHEPYKSKDVRYEYNRQLGYLTKKFDILMNVFKEKKMLDDTLFIVTSDHGQLLGEHGRGGHGIYLDDELIRVPLFINVKVEKRENKYISHTNLRKFILDFLEKDGKSKVDASKLYSDVAFSEAFGAYSNKAIVDPEFERHRIAVFYKKCKGIYDVEKKHFKFVSNPEFKQDLEEKINEFIKLVKFVRKMKEAEKIRSKIYKMKKVI